MDENKGRHDLGVELRSIFVGVRVVVRTIVRSTIVAEYIRVWESVYEVYLSQVSSLSKSSDKVIAHEQKSITWVATKCGQVLYVDCNNREFR